MENTVCLSKGKQSTTNSFTSSLVCLSFMFKKTLSRRVLIVFVLPPSVGKSGRRPGAGELGNQVGHSQRSAVLHRKEGKQSNTELKCEL